AYLPPTPQNDRRLAAARGKLRDRLKVATTLGYGPRFLHSTGQLHKGGPPIGHFLQITERPDQDIPIPGMPYTFGQLEAAQAEGDLGALGGRGRAAVRIDGLELLERCVSRTSSSMWGGCVARMAGTSATARRRLKRSVWTSPSSTGGTRRRSRCGRPAGCRSTSISITPCFTARARSVVRTFARSC